MSEHRPPLVQSLFPTGLEWLAVPSGFRDALSALPFHVHAVAGRMPGGWFRHFQAENTIGERLFGTIVPKQSVQGYQMADRLARRAVASGLATPLLIDAPCPLDGERFILLRAWVEGQHGPSKEIDFAACGRALGRLHAALGQASLTEQSATRARLDTITALHPAWRAWETVEHPASFHNLLAEWPSLARNIISQQSMCHGDIHAGNILFLAGGEPVFLDFEEAPHSALNPMTDLARFFERFILVQIDRHGHEWARAQAWQFFDAYLQVQPSTRFIPISGALAFHHALSVRICLSSGSASDAQWSAELEKIGQLIELSFAHRELIAKLDVSLGEHRIG